MDIKRTVDSQRLSARIGAWLSQTMEKKNETYATLSVGTGLDATTISTIVRHGRDVRLSTFVLLCRALGKDPASTLKELIK